MNHLRPHQVFDRVERADCLARICLPRRYSLTSMLRTSKIYRGDGKKRAGLGVPIGIFIIKKW